MMNDSKIIALIDGISTDKATILSASNFKSFVLKETKPDSSQIWTITWINGTQEFKYDISFPKGISAFKGSEYTSKAQLEGVFPTGITSEEFAMVQENGDLFIATYNAGAWKYRLLNNKVVFRKTDTTIDYKFSDEDDSKYKLFVNLSDIKGDKGDQGLKGDKGDKRKYYWIDNTKLAWESDDGLSMSVPVELKGVGVKGDTTPADEFVDAYGTSDGNVVFKLKKNDGTIYEMTWNNALTNISSFSNFGEYMGIFDINSLPTDIKKGWFWRVQTPFTHNGKQYPSGSLIIANKTKTSNIQELDFDFFTNRNSSVNIKIEEQRYDIVQDTYQLTLDNFDISKDGLLVTVSGGVRSGAVILNEGVDFNIINGNIINIISTKLINGDIVIVKKYIGVKEAYTKTWKSGENYFKDELIKSLANGLIYVCIKDITNSAIDPSLDVEHFKGISFTTSIPTFAKGNNYAIDNIVIDPNDESLYKCIKAITNAQIFPKDDTTFTTWKPLIKQGEGIYQLYLRTNTTDIPPKTEEQFLASLKGESLVYKGVYNNDTRYTRNQYIYYGSKIYVCTTNDILGVIAIPPIGNDTDNNWKILFEGNIDPSNIIDDALEASTVKTYSVKKINEKLSFKADKDSILPKGNTIPYIPQGDNDVCTVANVKNLINTDIPMSLIKDDANYVKTKNNLTDGLLSKLQSLQDNNKGYFINTTELYAKHPNGSVSVKNGDFAIVGENFWYYKDSLWHDSGSKSQGTGLVI